jgi:hypothetical protein
LSSGSPVATFDRALTLIRTYNSSFSPRSIIFRGGDYFVPTGVTLSATDSGLIISNYPGEQVTLSGGHWISKNAFNSVKDPSLLARLPAAARSSVVVVSLPDAAKITNYGSYSKIDSGQDGALHLYYKTKPMTIARWPNALREQDDRSAVLLASNAHHRQLKCARVCYRWYDHHYQWGVRFSD